MNGWEQFSSFLMDETREIIKKDIEKHSEDIVEMIKNRMLNTEGPRALEKELSKSEKIFAKIFSGFEEIDFSIQALKDIEKYISTFPYKSKKITKYRYIRYHTENYFNEMYILKERLFSYLTIIERVCRKKDSSFNNSKLIELREIVNNNLKNIINIRGQHVHKYRLEDNKLESLKLIEIFFPAEENGDGKMFKEIYDKIYLDTRDYWKKYIEDNNRKLINLLDIYSKSIIDILFDKKTNRIILLKNESREADR